MSTLPREQSKERHAHACGRLQVRQLYTAPTLIRSLEAQDDKYVTAHDRASLRVLGTVGEPINPRAWSWFFQARHPCVTGAAAASMLARTLLLWFAASRGFSPFRSGIAASPAA